MISDTEKLSVVAVAGPVPREGGGEPIGSESVIVPNTWYYRRQIADGSLREVEPNPAPPADSAGPTLDNNTPVAQAPKKDRP